MDASLQCKSSMTIGARREPGYRGVQPWYPRASKAHLASCIVSKHLGRCALAAGCSAHLRWRRSGTSAAQPYHHSATHAQLQSARDDLLTWTSLATTVHRVCSPATPAQGVHRCCSDLCGDSSAEGVPPPPGPRSRGRPPQVTIT